ncbi:MAG: hypothetical protein NW214_15130 [Pseudanabaenaceae cyanobacterium bins.39]|nr:hypothetical protein [Pseudanabaenaceae cyanobacterium bins.39]
MPVTDNLLHSLKAYIKTFGISDDQNSLKAITSTILRFHQQDGSSAIALMSPNQLVDQVMQKFAQDQSLPDVVDADTQQFVATVYQWQRSLEDNSLNTLIAYAHSLAPQQVQELTQNLLPQTLISILPLVTQVPLHQAEFDLLLQQVKNKFADANTMTNLLKQAIAPEYFAIAQKLTQALQFSDVKSLFEQKLLESASLANQSVENLTESFVNQELAKFLGTDAVQVDIDVDVQQMIVKQVVFKINMLQSSPPPIKSNEDIGNQIDEEVAKMKLFRSQLNFQTP